MIYTHEELIVYSTSIQMTIDFGFRYLNQPPCKTLLIIVVAVVVDYFICIQYDKTLQQLVRFVFNKVANDAINQFYSSFIYKNNMKKLSHKSGMMTFEFYDSS
ncbi:hypothetical protein T10_10635 [Trichinella papuae]|uniref:Uncharacterized protein n=1 Tax=Trichinella papuae TaxID=268474 RepID=A0A0V1MMQ3_9BILA|nr:hypothetical protein T10_10635 [Trichinella papuae]